MNPLLLTSHSLPLTPHPSSPYLFASPPPHLLTHHPFISSPSPPHLLTPHSLISSLPYLCTPHHVSPYSSSPHLLTPSSPHPSPSHLLNSRPSSLNPLPLISSLYDLLTPLFLISSPFTPFLSFTLHLLTSHPSPHHISSTPTPLSPHPSLPYLLTSHPSSPRSSPLIPIFLLACLFQGMLRSETKSLLLYLKFCY